VAGKQIDCALKNCPAISVDIDLAGRVALAGLIAGNASSNRFLCLA